MRDMASRQALDAWLAEAERLLDEVGNAAPLASAGVPAGRQRGPGDGEGPRRWQTSRRRLVRQDATGSA
jgi:hypothetical protein